MLKERLNIYFKGKRFINEHYALQLHSLWNKMEISNVHIYLGTNDIIWPPLVQTRTSSKKIFISQHVFA